MALTTNFKQVAETNIGESHYEIMTKETSLPTLPQRPQRKNKLRQN